jgi:hypothetical protein
MPIILALRGLRPAWATWGDPVNNNGINNNSNVSQSSVACWVMMKPLAVLDACWGIRSEVGSEVFPLSPF